MAQYRDDEREEYRPVRLTSLAGGVNNSKNETLIGLDESPDALNVDFDQDSVQSTGGAIKFNNQTAPSSAVRTRCDPALSPLMAASTPLGGAGNGLTGTVDVPLRGYGYFPYSPDIDIGGRFDSEGNFLISTEAFHIRRGRSFELNVSFQIPPEEKLYEAPTNGTGAPATITTFNPDNGFDEALDECICVVQKGGDRTAPMSWALAVVNVGNGAGLSLLPASRVSNYALAFIWYDAPQWGEFAASVMKYNLTSGQAVIAGAASQFSTQAYRAILIHKYVEPGRTYNVAVQLKMDTGTPGTTSPATNTAWNADGYFKVLVCDEGASPTTYSYVDTASPTTSLVEVVRGPTDSLSYLCRYGIRYAGKDAMFGGLGMRFHPWAKPGFIPFGMDCTPLKSGGFAMVDRSASTVATLYGAATYTLTAVHTSGDAFVVVNHQRLTIGNTSGGFDPKGWNTSGTTYSLWDGLNVAASGNANALRGYRLVAPNDYPAAGRGAIFTILDYFESGGTFRLNILNGATGAKYPTWAAAATLIQCFRWHQRDLVVAQVRIWGAPRAYDAGGIAGSRRAISLRSSIRLDDATELDIETLLACWNMDDAEGARVRELVVGGSRDGFLVPFGNATTDGGTRGEGMVFLSGEGEALTRDLSEDPIFIREVEKMLAGSSQGFGFEITCILTEAFYAIPVLETLPDPGATPINGYRPRLVPDLISWDIKDVTTTGMRAVPRPLLTLSMRNLLSSTDTRPFTRPTGFSVAVARSSDQENIDTIVPSDLLPWYRDSALDTHYRYDPTAPWVGRNITIQVGVQATASADVYDVYIALTPKDAFLPANGDPSDAEFAYWTDGAVGGSGTPYENNTYFTAAHLTIRRKDLARSVLTIGGRWNCKGKPGDTTNLGYGELNARMLVDEVRWFITSPAGALPTTSGAITARNGKLEGTNCLPPRELTPSDLLTPLGSALTAVNVTQGSTTVTSPSQAAIFTGEPRSTQDAVKGCYLYVTGDEFPLQRIETFGETTREWYFIPTVATTGASLTLSTSYADPSRSCAVGGVFRLAGYCAFTDDVRDRLLTLGKGKSYDASTTTVADVILTDDFWADSSVPGGGWKLRIYSPLGRSSAADILPQWTRGLVRERRGPDDGILGAHGFNEHVYCGVQGALYEADDRWREDGPTDLVTKSLAFRAASLPMGITAGLHADRVEFSSATNMRLIYNTPQSTTNFSLTDSWVIVLDFRGKIDSIDEYQTVLWVGDSSTDPSLSASSTGHKLNYILRLNRGRPEVVFGSTSAYTGTTKPEKGLFVATAQQAVEVGQWFQARFYLKTNTLGTVLEKPKCKINGKGVAVRVNATDVGVSATNDWLLTANIVSPGSGGLVLLGVGRDSYKAVDATMTFANGSVQGTYTPPQRVQGYLHSFNGQLAEIAVVTQPTWTGADPPDFDPNQIGYLGSGLALLFYTLGPEALGVGHRLIDVASVIPGVIRSHPFVSVYHAFGISQDPIAWGEYGAQLYATNGGKPAVIIAGNGYAAGVPVPSSAPSFTLERFPLWQKNIRSLTVDSDLASPVREAPASSANQNYHLSTTGNAYLLQPLSTADAPLMSWVQNGYLYLKGYFRLRSQAGRIQLWRRGRSSKQGSPFLDVRDGKLVFGWWDLDLKQEVSVQTSSEPILPGLVYYVNIRKRWPQRDTVEGNWENSFFTNGAIRRATLASSANGGFQVGDVMLNAASGNVGRVVKTYGAAGTFIEYLVTGTAIANGDALYVTAGGVPGNLRATATNPVTITRPMHDLFIVRRFSTGAEITGLIVNEWQLYADSNYARFPRICISLTTDAYGIPAGCNATGMVSCPGLTFTGVLTNGSLFVAAPAAFVGFQRSMLGLYWVWGSDAGTAFAGKRYRIITFVDAAGAPVPTDTAVGIRVAAVEAGDSVDFSGITAKTGGVFWGTALKKSASFDASRTPDNSAAAIGSIEFMGSSTQGQNDSDYAPFDGEWWCPGWGVTTPATAGTNAQCFEALNTSAAGAATDDPIFTGTDVMRGQNSTAGAPDEPSALRFTDALQVWCTDGQDYAPAGANNFTDGATAQPNTSLKVVRSSAATSPTSTSSAAADPTWQYLQAPAVWQGQRQIAVAFFDEIQNIPGDAGPQLTIKPQAEDVSNPSGTVRVRLSNLPVTNRATQLWIYESLADGSVGALFKVLEVAMGTAEVTVQFTDEQTTLGLPLEFTNAEPPRCALLATSGSRVVYGGLEVQPDACLASKVGFPGQVDFTKLFRLNSGFGSRVTALVDLDGFLVGFKRRSVAGITFNATNDAIVDAINSGTGCVANATAMAKDGLVLFLSDKGMQSVSRAGVTNLALPQWIGQKVKSTFERDVDKRRLFRACAALNQKRAQYVLAYKRAARREQNARLSVDVRGDGQPRYSLYESPTVTALASVQRAGGGIERLVGGTEEGFMVWLDDDRARSCMLGPNGAIWGQARMSIGSASTVGLVVNESGRLDTSLEGERGAVIRWVNATDMSVREALCLGTDSNVMHFANVLEKAPDALTEIVVGALAVRWESPWIDTGNPDTNKRAMALYLILEKEVSGELQVDVYANFDRMKPFATQMIDLTVDPMKPKKVVELGDVDGLHLKFVVSAPALSYDVHFALASAVWRVNDQDQN